MRTSKRCGVDNFKHDCSCYLYQKEKINKIEHENYYLFIDKFVDEARTSKNYFALLAKKEIVKYEIEILKRNVRDVEAKLKIIEDKCGKEYKELVYEHLILKKSQQTVADKHHMHFKTVSYKLNKTYKILFE